jgi:predicted TIM-barrel fold metal-dependent hydrolase
MTIVDAQVHIWANHVPTNPNHRQVPTFSAEDLLKEMDAAGVEAAVIHPPGWDPDSNALAIEAARRHPARLAILGNFPLDRPESRALIDGWKDRPGMLGLRFTFLQPHQKTWPTDGTLDWLWPAAERAGIPVALLAGSFLPLVEQVAARHPGLRLIVDHFGRPSGTKDDAAWASLPELLALAKHPNVAVKATGAPSYSSEPYPYRNIHGHLRRVYDAFGPERMFWGTDITRMPCSWRQCVTMFTEELPWLAGRDRERVMGGGLCAWLGWKRPGAPAAV